MADGRATVLAPYERLDRLAKRLYGTEQGGTVEALLDANPGLAALSPFVPGGTTLMVPEVDTTPPDDLLRPWE